MRHTILILIFAATGLAQTPAQLMNDSAVRAALDIARRNEPLGTKAHVPGETLDLTRQPIQTKRTALLIYRLTHP